MTFKGSGTQEEVKSQGRVLSAVLESLEIDVGPMAILKEKSRVQKVYLLPMFFTSAHS